MSLAFDNFHLSKPRKPVSVPTEAWETAPNSKVLRYIECSVAENTRKAYDSDLKLFLDWGGHIPATTEMVAAYLADHADEHALRDWLETACITEGPVFRSISRYGRALKRLSTNAVATIIKDKAKAVGFNPEKVSGHSLRAGIATSAANIGWSSWKIRQQTGHSTEVMLQQYFRETMPSRAVSTLSLL